MGVWPGHVETSQELGIAAPRFRFTRARIAWALGSVLLGALALGVLQDHRLVRVAGSAVQPRVPAHEGPAFAARRAASGLILLSNAPQDLRVSVGSEGLELSGAQGLKLGLASLAVGRGEAPARVSGRPRVSLHANGVRLWAAPISEWFVNSAKGLEQGFTLAHRPTGAGELTISQTVSGNTRGSVDAAGRSVTFSSRGGLLRYEGLSVTDARGHQVQAWLGLAGRRLTITIADRQALYPLQIDPVMVTPVVQSPASNAATGLKSKLSRVQPVRQPARDVKCLPIG